MGEFLRASEITETRSFTRSFVKGVVVSPGRAVINYAVPMPEDSPVGQSKVADLELEAEVRRKDQRGGPILTIDRTIFEMWLGLPPRPE